MITKALYRYLTHAARPFLNIWPHVRARQGKEISHRISERFGIAKTPRPMGQIVWFHAASNGEALSALPLIEYFLNLETPPYIVVTTMTVTAAHLIESRTPKTHVTHQFIPYDHPSWIKKFHAHWQPDMAVWIESELWPNHLAELKKRNIPSVLVNARLSDRSVKRWTMARHWFQSMMSAFDVILAQTERDKDNIKSLGIDRVQSIGNLKDYAGALPYDEHALTDLQNCVGARPVVLFASTHNPEEKMAAEIHTQLKADFPNVLTIILPRHPKRAKDIIDQINQGPALKIAQRSLKMSPRSDTDIYLADTLGETGLFYKFCPIVFIGNSMNAKPGGGHNMMEPAWFDCAIITGHDNHNFSTLAKEMPGKNALKIINNQNELANEAKALLQDSSAQKNMADKAYEYAEHKHKSGLSAIIKAIELPCQRAEIL